MFKRIFLKWQRLTYFHAQSCCFLGFFGSLFFDCNRAQSGSSLYDFDLGSNVHDRV